MEGFEPVVDLLVVLAVVCLLFIFRRNRKIVSITTACGILGLGLYVYSSSRQTRAVEEAMQEAVDACTTGNAFLLDEKIVQAHSVFRDKLSTREAFDAENRLHNRLVYLGCKKY